ncbi:MAG: NAD(P)/FAD-dependent oxidoreductase [Myroides sp.]|jgi:thioredoxin reductase|nr:NAD(P)/FAD-dependent oxidoreductase [Myroides sp.]
MVSRREFIHKSTLARSTILVANSLESFVVIDSVDEDEFFDVIIIGGSYAGLSAALTLGRSMCKVLILDSNEPCNRMTPHSHNFLTQDGVAPGQISAKAKEQVLKYETVLYYSTQVEKVDKTANQTFLVHSVEQKKYKAKFVLFATGLMDMLLPIKGYADCWGKSVIHCSYCHGYEQINRTTAILANGDLAFHLLMLASPLTTKLSILTNGQANFTVEQQNIINRKGIKIIETPITELKHKQGQVSEVVFRDNSNLQVKVIYSRPAVIQKCNIPSQLGCELTEQGLLKVDNQQESTIPRVYACGDMTSFRSVATAIATGSAAGRAINAQLCQLDFKS